MYETNRKCAINGLTLTTRNYTFIPVAPNPNFVTKFELLKSIVPVLTANICTTFTKLRHFTAIEQYIEIVEDYAFNNCTDVIDINLEKNNIHKLGTGIFSNTKKLQRVHILGGSLSNVDIDLFNNLGELTQLLFSANGLKELPIASIKNLKKLELLYLYSNDLTDLDADGLVANLPSLKSIYINDNNFHCDRLIEIIEIFQAKKIKVPDHTYEKHLKKRDYIPRKISNIICLSQAQLEAERLKKALAGSLEDLKDLPLGEAVIQLKNVVDSGLTDADSEIVILSNSVNDTLESLNEKISCLYGTFQNSSIEITGSIDELRQNFEILEHHLLENNAKILQRHDEAISSLTEKYKLSMNGTVPCGKTIQDSTGKYESLNNSIIAVWICIAILLLINLATCLWVTRKSRNVNVVDTSSLCYEELMKRNDL